MKDRFEQDTPIRDILEEKLGCSLHMENVAEAGGNHGRIRWTDAANHKRLERGDIHYVVDATSYDRGDLISPAVDAWLEEHSRGNWELMRLHCGPDYGKLRDNAWVVYYVQDHDDAQDVFDMMCKLLEATEVQYQ